jgi:hypothetical protein
VAPAYPGALARGEPLAEVRHQRPVAGNELPHLSSRLLGALGLEEEPHGVGAPGLSLSLFPRPYGGTRQMARYALGGLTAGMPISVDPRLALKRVVVCASHSCQVGERVENLLGVLVDGVDDKTRPVGVTPGHRQAFGRA